MDKILIDKVPAAKREALVNDIRPLPSLQSASSPALGVVPKITLIMF